MRIEFFSADGQIEEDIQDPAALHTWINAHFAQIARYGRGAGREHADTTLQSGTDYLDAFGNELADKVVPEVAIS